MSLREDILDAIIDGKIGKGIVVTREEVMRYFSNITETYTGVILSNSEITAEHSYNYDRFTLRIEDGKYRIHPKAILERMKKRSLL